ncbi:hypothetical protein NHP190012_11630 [Helicobacter sp. NHP19-012]|uniref:Restriction endonuclease n=1 Tax=Helicobacter gastrofelis TaxID=2849642 RepID=A0ABM7SIT8_9HELI|nr:hypothetical protein [Helicobacter sp. NHP19-012]BCZ19521.1 hypothetical protein NHP190012_11630 [Helicobacter sp. NHP19-012]
MEKIMWHQEQKQTFQGLLQEFVTLIDEAVEEWETKGKTPAPTAPKGACSALQRRINTFLERWGYVCVISPGFGNLANEPAIAFFRQNILGKSFVNSEKATPRKGFYIWFTYFRKKQPKIFDLYIGRSTETLEECRKCAAFLKLFDSEGYLLYGYVNRNLNTLTKEIADYFLNLVAVFNTIPQDDFRVTSRPKIALEEMTNEEVLPLAPPVENMHVAKEHTHAKQQASSTLKIYGRYENYKESDLHSLLTCFAFHKMGLYTKTIYDRRSLKGLKGENEGLHPDMVGVFLDRNMIGVSFERKSFNVNSEALEDVLKSLDKLPIRIVSFELKKEIKLSNCDEYYKQAIGNSSWAHEGYLVTGRIDLNDTKLIDLLELQNSSHGIGVILLNMQDINNSKVLFKAKTKELNDKMCTKLHRINPDFRDFF